MLHKDSLLGWRHAVHNWEVADITALNALTVVAADIGKIAKVASPLGFYFLVNDTGPVWTKIDKPLTYFSFTRTDTLSIITGEARWYPAANTTAINIRAWVSTAPVGANIIAQIKKNGTLLHTVTILAGATTYAETVVAYALLSTDYLTVDITQVGSATPGKNLTIRLGFQ